MHYFQAMVNIGWYIPAMNFKQKARSTGGFCYAYASSIPVPSKEIVNAVKTFSTSSVAR